MSRLPPVSTNVARVFALLAVVTLLCTLGCTIGPRYKRPIAQAPDTWKGEGPWEAAAPKDAIPKGAWWQIFHDAADERSLRRTFSP